MLLSAKKKKACAEASELTTVPVVQPVTLAPETPICDPPLPLFNSKLPFETSSTLGASVVVITSVDVVPMGAVSVVLTIGVVEMTAAVDVAATAVVVPAAALLVMAVVGAPSVVVCPIASVVTQDPKCTARRKSLPVQLPRRSGQQNRSKFPEHWSF